MTGLESLIVRAMTGRAELLAPAHKANEQNARIEHDRALARVMTAVLKDDTELFKQFVDNPDFKRWLADMVFALTYRQTAAV